MLADLRPEVSAEEEGRALLLRRPRSVAGAPVVFEVFEDVEFHTAHLRLGTMREVLDQRGRRLSPPFDGEIAQRSSATLDRSQDRKASVTRVCGMWCRHSLIRGRVEPDLRRH